MSAEKELDIVHDRAAYVWEGRGNWNLAPREEREIGYAAFAGAWDAISEQFIAEGWRKKPTEAEVIAVLDDDMNWDVGELSPVLLMEQTARAILALMDRGQ